MELAVKKIQLIEWLVRLQDESILQQIEFIKNTSTEESYNKKSPKNINDIKEKIFQSESDIDAGRVLAQEEVELYFKNKLGSEKG